MTEKRQPDIELYHDPIRPGLVSHRTLKPAPQLKDESRFQRRVDNGAGQRRSAHASQEPYVVIGVFDDIDRWPKEWVLRLKYPSLTFWQIWWHMVRLRGLSYVFSLKDVTQFRLYKVSLAIHFGKCANGELVQLVAGN